jgi:hypothetical protein
MSLKDQGVQTGVVSVFASPFVLEEDFLFDIEWSGLRFYGFL